MNKLYVPYKIIKSNRKSIAIQIMPDGEVVVRCPKGMRVEEVKRFVDSKADWIQKHLANRPAQNTAKYTPEELNRIKAQARKLVAQRVRFYAPIVGVTYNQVTIRLQHTRWGSCSGKGNLNFNGLLALVPAEVLDYVVVHELCHRKEMNHSTAFWAEVAKVLPDYKRRKKWLKEHGAALIARLPE